MVPSRRRFGRAPRRPAPRTAAVLAIGLAALAWAALSAGGFAAERAACPEDHSWLVTSVALASSAAASAALALAVDAYRATASHPGSDALLAAAALYVAALAWVGSVAGTVILLAVDLCTL